MRPKPTIDQKVKIVWNYFTIERAEWKQIVSMSEFKKAKQETVQISTIYACQQVKIWKFEAKKF